MRGDDNTAEGWESGDSAETTNHNQAAFCNLGNSFTLSRLALLPFIIAGISLKIGWLAAAGMAISLVTDLLDGRVSRLMGTASQFGRNLDSTVDFVLLNSLFIALFAAGRIYWYQFAVVYIALLITLLLQLITSSVMSSGEVIVTRMGKPAGALEYAYLLFLIAREVLTRSRTVEVLGWVLFFAVALTIAVYVFECIFKMRRLV